jgi:hypothetical protein
MSCPIWLPLPSSTNTYKYVGARASIPRSHVHNPHRGRDPDVHMPVCTSPHRNTHAHSHTRIHITHVYTWHCTHRYMHGTSAGSTWLHTQVPHTVVHRHAQCTHSTCAQMLMHTLVHMHSVCVQHFVASHPTLYFSPCCLIQRLFLISTISFVSSLPHLFLWAFLIFSPDSVVTHTPGMSGILHLKERICPELG